MEMSSKIARLEADLKTLITRWDRFFAGDLRVPPVNEKQILGRRIRGLGESQTPIRSADRFRLEQLQHRFMSYVMNWERMLREQEEGVRRYVPGGRPNPVPSPGAEESPERGNAEDPATVQTGESDLFDRWCAAKVSVGEDVKMDRQAFENQITSQREKIEGRMGATVVFDVSVVDGNVKLTAKRAAQTKNRE